MKCLKESYILKNKFEGAINMEEKKTRGLIRNREKKVEAVSTYNPQNLYSEKKNTNEGKSNLLKQSSLRCTVGTKNRVNALSSIIPDIKTNEEMLNLILDKFEENLSTDEKTELRLVLNVLNRKS